MIEERSPICSQCKTGKWHGRFERFMPQDRGYVRVPGSYLLRAATEGKEQ